MHVFKPVSFLMAGALMLVGCGGGGDGGGERVVTDLAAISAQNAADAAATGYDTSQSVLRVGAIGGLLVTSSGGRTGFNLAAFLRMQLQRITGTVAQPYSYEAAAVITHEQACTGGGTATYSLNDVDGNLAASTGDTLSITFANCVESGLTYNGDLSLTEFTLSGDPAAGPYSMGATFAFTNFHAAGAGESHSIAGAYGYSEATADNVVYTANVTIGSLSYTGMDGTESSTYTFTNFSASGTNNLATGAYTFSSEGKVDDSTLGGSITIATVTEFAGVAPGDPTSGVMKVTGAANSSVTLSAMSDGVNVELAVDADGNGVAEETIATTWEQL